MNQEEVLFFDGFPNALAAYAVLRELIMTRYPGTTVSVKKMQIGFGRPLLFAIAWLPRRKKDGDALKLSFCLPGKVVNERIWMQVEPYPGRFMHHMFIRSVQELDAEVIAWLDAAAEFAGRKR